MIVDSSAVVAILLRETSSARVKDMLLDAGSAGIGAPTLVETGIVMLRRLGPAGRSLVARATAEFQLETIPFHEGHWPVALDAFARFGKGRHAAGLNFGDCMTYATAALAGEPLLCVGDDFAKTDLELA